MKAIIKARKFVKAGKEIKAKYNVTAEQACNFLARQWGMSNIGEDWEYSHWYKSLPQAKRIKLYEAIDKD